MKLRPLPILISVLMSSLLILYTGYANTDDAFAPCQVSDPETIELSEECLEIIAAHPEPSVSEVSLDGYTLSNYTYWRVGPGAANFYDAPGGNVVGGLDAGFNFVVAINTSIEGWVQIQGGQWMRAEDVRVYEPSTFRGVTLLNGLEQPFGWVMDNMYTSEYPGGSQSIDNGRLLFRYDRVNLFSEVEMDGWKWYMVGPDQWIEQRLLAIAKRVERPETISGRWVGVDLYEQTLVAYEDDLPVFATLVSTGLPDWDTREGIFEVWARIATDGMSGAVGAPDFYALQSVPWVMYFDEAISLHGTYWHNGFGYRHSHGCVNLSISDARFLFNWTGQGEPNEDGEIITHVYVYSSGVYGDTQG